jgi:hypothetical protein
MKEEIAHHGNGNYKRKFSTCGSVVSRSDSVDPVRVNCINCIELLLKRQITRNSKTDRWERKLTWLREQEAVIVDK